MGSDVRHVRGEAQKELVKKFEAGGWKLVRHGRAMVGHAGRSGAIGSP